MQRVHDWLAPFTWEIVTAQNAVLCQAKDALHKPTSDGHDATRKLWEEHHRQAMPLEDAVDLCRRCHRLALFCFYNGNTFASVIALVIKRLALPRRPSARDSQPCRPHRRRGVHRRGGEGVSRVL